MYYNHKLNTNYSGYYAIKERIIQCKTLIAVMDLKTILLV